MLQVVGVDLSANMVAICNNHLARLRNEGVRSDVTGELVADMVTVHEANIFDVDLPQGPFDAVYSRDCILHIGDKAGLFRRMLHHLRPG